MAKKIFLTSSPLDVNYCSVFVFHCFPWLGETEWLTCGRLWCCCTREATLTVLLFFICIFSSLSCHAAAEAGCWICCISPQPTIEEVGDLEMLKMDFEFSICLRSPAAAAASRLSTAFLQQFCLSSAASPAVRCRGRDGRQRRWCGGDEGSWVSVTLKEEIPKHFSKANY